MYLTVISNSDEKNRDKYEIARTIYAETGAISLRVVEAFAAMIANAASKRGTNPINIVRDADMFGARCVSSPRNVRWRVEATSPAFHMCLRITTKMLNGTLGDVCSGATRFHHDDEMPDWAIALGYVADVDGILFYA